MSNNVTEADLVRCYEELIDAELLVQELRDQCEKDLNLRLHWVETRINNIRTGILREANAIIQTKQHILEDKENKMAIALTALQDNLPSICQEIEQATDDFVQSDILKRLTLEIHRLEQADREKDRILMTLKTGVLMPKMEEPREGVLIWKIDNILLRIHEAKTGKVLSLDSTEFLTGNTGYRMVLRVYLNGNGTGEGSHISIYLKILNGTYNRLLDWPFQQKVTLSLLCPDDPTKNITGSFNPDPDSPSFGFTESENPGFGFEQFAPVSVLEGNTFIQRYTLFVKCVVDKGHYMPDTRRDIQHFQ